MGMSFVKCDVWFEIALQTVVCGGNRLYNLTYGIPYHRHLSRFKSLLHFSCCSCLFNLYIVVFFCLFVFFFKCVRLEIIVLVG